MKISLQFLSGRINHTGKKVPKWYNDFAFHVGNRVGICQMPTWVRKTGNKKVLLTAQQPKNLKKMLVTAKFDLRPELLNRKPNGLFSCMDSIYHKNGYTKPCKSFTFKLTNGKSDTWNYNKLFDCDSKDVLYILICNNCDYFYLGKTIDFKQRIHKHKSDVKHPWHSW